MLVEGGVRVPERVALVVEAPPLVDEDVSRRVEVARIEEFRIPEASGPAEQRGRELKLAEQAAEGDVRDVVQRSVAEEADRVLVECRDDIVQRAFIDGAREVDAIDFRQERRSLWPRDQLADAIGEHAFDGTPTVPRGQWPLGWGDRRPSIAGRLGFGFSDSQPPGD